MEMGLCQVVEFNWGGSGPTVLPCLVDIPKYSVYPINKWVSNTKKNISISFEPLITFPYI